MKYKNVNQAKISNAAKRQVKKQTEAYEEVLDILVCSSRPLPAETIVNRCRSEARYVEQVLNTMTDKPEVERDPRGYRIAPEFGGQIRGMCDSCDQEMVYHENLEREFCPVCEDL